MADGRGGGSIIETGVAAVEIAGTTMGPEVTAVTRGTRRMGGGEQAGRGGGGGGGEIEGRRVAGAGMIRLEVEGATGVAITAAAATNRDITRCSGFRLSPCVMSPCFVMF